MHDASALSSSTQTRQQVAVLEARCVTTAFAGQVIHQDLNLSIYPQEIVALIGGSGSGKTTLIRRMIGLEKAQSGEFLMFNQLLKKQSIAQYQQSLRRIGMLFQHGALFSALSVFDNVAVPLRELKLPESMIIKNVMQKLAWVGIDVSQIDRRPAQLSGGMIKRVALARALALEPEVLILDEPTAGLDPKRSKDFCELILNLHQQMRLTVLMVTHDLDTLQHMATHVAVLADKKIIVKDSLDAVKKISHPFIQSFFSAASD